MASSRRSVLYPDAILWGRSHTWHLLRPGYERLTRCGRVASGGSSRVDEVDDRNLCVDCERSYLRAQRT